VPVLWLFTDPAKMPDVLDVISRLPGGYLCGVVYRHDFAPERAVLGLAVARLCRAKKIALVVAGDTRLAARLGAGVHLRKGQRGRCKILLRKGGLLTSSVHNTVEMSKARRAGCDILFASPVFPTASHPGGAVLGGFGFRQLAARAPGAKLYALGGIQGGNVRSLGRYCRGAGAIDALLCRPDIEI
jgi:thiamine-phosphate pyrophosphorylase